MSVLGSFLVLVGINLIEKYREIFVNIEPYKMVKAIEPAVSNGLQIIDMSIYQNVCIN